MRKINVLSVALTGLLFFYCSASFAQTASVQKYIERSNQQFIKWFNSGKADSIVFQYHPKGCLASGGCGTAVIQNHYRTEVGKYTFRELKTLKVEVKDTVATETGHWRLLLPTGTELAGNYRTEWRKVNKQWLIFREELLN
ncbi:MAG TPA: hypothetical protein PKL56_16715 [Cyclobacteriaceae bacterium]|nr:nuclear transport factor 2 family protein [Cyclobacteriaceae bacterium]HMV09269.1 hypothetical protein [Cyclobacteriaceae bacterium]HMV91254.1 hypothetical protein [Cyclobacteriaceae bacterium]HMX01931.1 hypothetical protein [Cyclobacteriaceae bacterium]HMX50854.1 hypothetical protein [Cyclobacteriaceae bacterium]